MHTTQEHSGSRGFERVCEVLLVGTVLLGICVVVWYREGMNKLNVLCGIEPTR